MPLTKVEISIKGVGEPKRSAFAEEGDLSKQVAVTFDYPEQGAFYLPEGDPRIEMFRDQIGKPAKLVTVNISKTGKLYLAD